MRANQPHGNPRGAGQRVGADLLNAPSARERNLVCGVLERQWPGVRKVFLLAFKAIDKQPTARLA